MKTKTSTNTGAAPTDAAKTELLSVHNKWVGEAWVRILDFCEVEGCAPGEKVVIQLLSYEDGEYHDRDEFNSRRFRRLSAANLLVRRELAYDGPIRLAVAVEGPKPTKEAS